MITGRIKEDEEEEKEELRQEKLRKRKGIEMPDKEEMMKE